MKYLKTYESHAVDFERMSTPLGVTVDKNKWDEYQFIIDDIKYNVSFFTIRDRSILSFSVLDDKGEWNNRNLIKSNPFTTMNTITQIVKEFVENHPNVDTIEFFGIKEGKTMVPDWLIKIISSSKFISNLAVYLDISTTPPNWMSKPTRRTNMFTRWANKEVKSINWSAKRIGNQVKLVRNKI